MDWVSVASAGIWGGALALERKAFLQAMLSRPLVAATGMGLILGDVDSGLSLGVVLELYYLGSASLGAALPEHDTLVATGATAAAAMVSKSAGYGGTPTIWTLSILAFLWLGILGRALDRMLGGYSARLAANALATAELDELTRAIRHNLWGMWPHFIAFGAITSACAVLGSVCAQPIAELPLPLARGLAWAYPAMASVAAAVAAQGSRARYAAAYAGGAGFLVAVGMSLWAWYGVGT